MRTPVQEGDDDEQPGLDCGALYTRASRRRPRSHDRVFRPQVETLRPQLLRYARTQLRNDAWAEDAVSDTLLAALEKPEAFAGRSQLKTWLVGMLKHKVVDQLRRHAARCSRILGHDGRRGVDELLFDGTGHWRDGPADWGDPETALRPASSSWR